ncbi:MAG: ribonuclease PH [Candidatus Omnitrophota bacterium]
MRSDGRMPNGMRKINIVPGYIEYAEGSCLFEAGKTKVVCTASIEDGVPPFLRGKGTGWITSEYSMLPRSCQKRVPRESTRGKTGGRTHEIQRLIGRAMRSVVNMDVLGERTIWIDCDVLQADGGTRCAAINGSFIALCLALNKLKKEKKLSELPVHNFVAAVSVGIVKGAAYLDINYDEDSTAEVDMNVVMTDAGEFVELQGTAEKEPFSRERMDEMLELALKGINSIIIKQKEILQGAGAV